MLVDPVPVVPRLNSYKLAPVCAVHVKVVVLDKGPLRGLLN